LVLTARYPAKTATPKAASLGAELPEADHATPRKVTARFVWHPTFLSLKNTQLFKSPGCQKSPCQLEQPPRLGSSIRLLTHMGKLSHQLTPQPHCSQMPGGWRDPREAASLRLPLPLRRLSYTAGTPMAQASWAVSS